jgi:hypothetical protein
MSIKIMYAINLLKHGVLLSKSVGLQKRLAPCGADVFLVQLISVSLSRNLTDKQNANVKWGMKSTKMGEEERKIRSQYLRVYLSN